MMINTNSKIYVPGHTGLIGSSILQLLAERGFKNIITCDRKDLNLETQSSVDEFISLVKPDFIINCSGYVGGIADNLKNPAFYINRNIIMQSNLINAAHKYDIKKFIYFGSSCMYPKDAIQPLNEDSLCSGKLENSSLPYALAKLAGVQTCLSYNNQFSYNKFIPVIPNTVYGPNDNFNKNSGHVISALISKIHEAKLKDNNRIYLWGSGTPLREFIYSYDLARACLILLEHDQYKFKLPVNIGSGQEISIKELAKIIAEIICYNGEIYWDKNMADGASRKFLDSSKINSLGWNARINIYKGIKKTYTWFLSNKINSGG